MAKALRQIRYRFHLAGVDIAWHAALGFEGDGDDGIARLLVNINIAFQPTLESAVCAVCLVEAAIGFSGVLEVGRGEIACDSR